MGDAAWLDPGRDHAGEGALSPVRRAPEDIVHQMETAWSSFYDRG